VRCSGLRIAVLRLWESCWWMCASLGSACQKPGAHENRVGSNPTRSACALTMLATDRFSADHRDKIEAWMAMGLTN
jgi:hypothetical protein